MEDGRWPTLNRTALSSILYLPSSILHPNLVPAHFPPCPLSVYLEAMPKKLFLLDGMALVYRAHFALIARPIFTSKGVNTSALYGFTQTLLEILKNHQPTHIAVAFDTDAHTQRHAEISEYKETPHITPQH